MSPRGCELRSPDTSCCQSDEARVRVRLLSPRATYHVDAPENDSLVQLERKFQLRSSEARSDRLFRYAFSE